MEMDKKERIAAFRFGVIHDLVGNVELDPGEQEKLIRDKCERKWVIPFSDKTRITRSTIMRWVKLYKDSGGRLESLRNQDRSDCGSTRAVDEETGLALMRVRREFPKAPVARVITEMKTRGLISPGLTLTPTTVYRFLKRNGLMDKETSGPEDRRRFEAELPNDLWQCDVMRGPMVEHEDKRRKTYLIAFIDDHSRLIPHAEFYLSENLKSFLNAFEQALLKRGLPRKLYTDNGSAFRSRHLEHTTASLGIALIHAKPYKPQGKGKIERFFRTVRSDFLSGFKGTTLKEINHCLALWLEETYHGRAHCSTGQTPFARFTAKMECLRPAPPDLRDHFRTTARRRVAKDRTISLDGRVFEAPVVLIGKQVALVYHQDEPERVEIMLGGKSFGPATPLDVHVNCRVKRDKWRNIEPDGPGAQPYKGGGLFGKDEDQ
jgi:transposase InsO family protein